MNSNNSSPHTMIRIVLSAVIIIGLSIQALFAQTWTSVGSATQPRNAKSIAISSAGTTAYLADQTYLFKTTNSGTAWTATGDGLTSPLFVACRPDDPSKVVVSIAGYIMYSSTGGDEFPTSIGYSSLVPLCMAVSTVNSSNMFVGAQYVSGYYSVYKSSDGGQNWGNLTSFNYATNVSDVAPYPTNDNPNDVWVGGASPNGAAEGSDPNATASTRGIWFSTNSGTNWYGAKMGDYNVKAIAVHANYPNPEVYAGTASGKIFLSTDGGVNWSEKTTITGATVINAIKTRTDSNIVFVASNKGISRSTDNGTTWGDRLVNRHVLTLAIAPSNQNVMYATTADSVFKSTDYGTTWTDVNSGIGILPQTAIMVSGSNVFAISNQYSSLAKYNGSSWSTAPLLGLLPRGLGTTSGGNILVAGSRGDTARLFQSTDGGSTFNKIDITSADGVILGNHFNGIVRDPQNANYIYVFGRGSSNSSVKYNLYYSKTGIGTTWYLCNVTGSTGSNTFVTSMVIDSGSGSGGYSNTMYAGLDNGSIYRSTNEGGSWVSVKSGYGCINSMAFCQQNDAVIYAATPYGVIKTGDYGTTWSNIHTGSFKKVFMRPGWPNDANHIGIVSSDGSTIYYSNDGGVNWVTSTGDIITPVNDVIGVSGSPSTLYAGTDVATCTLTSITSAPTLSSPEDQASYTVFNVPLQWGSVSSALTYHLMVSTNSDFTSPRINSEVLTGTSFTNYNLGVETLYWKVAASNLVGESNSSSYRAFTISSSSDTFIVTLSYNASKNPILTWNSQGSNLVYTIYRYQCAFGDYDCGTWPYTVYTTTGSTSYTDYGITRYTKPETPLSTYFYEVRCSKRSNKVHVDTGDPGGIEKTTTDVIPKVTALKDNYPNPFNPVTTLQYDLSKDGHVTLKIFNVLGQEVAVLVNGEQTAGTRSVQFDASKLASGLYFSRLEASGYTGMKKLMLVK